jgi:hypothetical protein
MVRTRKQEIYKVLEMELLETAILETKETG